MSSVKFRPCNCRYCYATDNGRTEGLTRKEMQKAVGYDLSVVKNGLKKYGFRNIKEAWKSIFGISILSGDKILKRMRSKF